MEGMVSYLLHQSINVSFVIVVVYLTRGILLRKLPKKYAFMLWAVVAVRLVFPGVEAPVGMFSLLPVEQAETTVREVSKERDQSQNNAMESESTDTDVAVEQQKDKRNAKGNLEDRESMDKMPQKTTARYQVSKSVGIREKISFYLQKVRTSMINSRQNTLWMNVLGSIWLAGMLIFWGWNGAIFLRMRKRMAYAVRFRDNIFECEEIRSPFVMGLFRPKIYIPFHMDEKEHTVVLKHEKYHIDRKDYLINYLACILLSIYWFHPLVWLAYKSMVKDMEMSCDEYVLRDASLEERTRYSEVLLAFASGRSGSPVGVLSFGENDTKERVKRILKGKKAGKWMSIFGVCVVVLVFGICLTNQRSNAESQKNPETKESVKQSENTEIPENTEFPESSSSKKIEQEYVYFATEDGGDIGQLGEEGYYYSQKDRLKRLQETSEQSEYETVVYETTADLNQDGIKDLVQVICISSEKQPDIEMEAAGNGTFYVRVYRGLQNGGYEKEARFISCSWDASHAGNGEICLIQKDGKDYLLYGQMYEMQGVATYGYGIIFIDDQKGIQIVEEYWNNFETEDLQSTESEGSEGREKALSKLQKRIAPWLENSFMLVVEDCNQEYFYCIQEGKERNIMDYYKRYHINLQEK